MVSTHLLNIIVATLPGIGKQAYLITQKNPQLAGFSNIIQYASVALLLLGIMYWRNESICDKNKKGFGELLTDTVVLYIFGYWILPILSDLNPIIGIMTAFLPGADIVLGGWNMMWSFIFYKLFTKCS